MTVLDYPVGSPEVKRGRRTLSDAEVAIRDIGRRFGRKGEGARELLLYVERDSTHSRFGEAVVTDSFSLATFAAGSAEAAAIGWLLADVGSVDGKGSWVSVRKNLHPTTGILFERSTRPPVSGAALWDLFPNGERVQIVRWVMVPDLVPGSAGDVWVGCSADGDRFTAATADVLSTAGADGSPIDIWSTGAADEGGWSFRPLLIGAETGRPSLAMPIRLSENQRLAARERLAAEAVSG